MCSLAVSNDPQVLRTILENSNVSSSDKNFMLRVAAMAGRKENIKVLLEAGADVQNISAVAAAAGHHQVESLKLLCEQGASVNEKDFISAIHKATGRRQERPQRLFPYSWLQGFSGIVPGKARNVSAGGFVNSTVKATVLSLWQPKTGVWTVWNISWKTGPMWTISHPEENLL